MAVESPTGGPNDVVQNNILYRHYGIAGDGDLIPGFRRCIGSTRVGGPDGRGEVSDPYGGSEPSAVGAELPLLRDTWHHRTRSQSGERVRGRWPGEVRAGSLGPGCSAT